MAERRCRKCQKLYDNGGKAALPFCRGCIQQLPPEVRSGIMTNAKGSAARDAAIRQAERVWLMK